MRGLACIHAASLIAKRAAGLSDAERLRLEQHLDGCGACNADARDVARLAGLARSRAMPELAPRARERALTGALRQLGGEARGGRARRPRWAPAGAALGFAGAVAAAYFAFVRPAAAPAPSAQVAVELGPVVAVLVPEQRIEVTEPTELAAGDAAVRLEAGAAVYWRPEAHTLRLHAGRVRAKLAPEAREPFRIETRRFVAEGAGAELEVTPVSVTVLEGTARVFAPDGEVYVDELVAGEAWQAPAPRRARESASGPGVDELLTVARRRIAVGEVATARRELAAALSAAPSRRQRAEAETLLAECALVAGDPDRASALYLRVARRYRDMPAGENALFAAARIRANAGQRAAARRALRLYLDRYPDGRFGFEARARLDALDRGSR